MKIEMYNKAKEIREKIKRSNDQINYCKNILLKNINSSMLKFELDNPLYFNKEETALILETLVNDHTKLIYELEEEFNEL